eukprot:TRINITY_DN53841_c0_g1_i1.p1 TRINITY_DN53841_c0_g1~~TRINITY_DN53841_c0_g1_i1.p1  ORF type:complete len:726 (-),score=125.51 TRINITY_DN53841_c0_g1_i1:463-2604(-)
MASPCRASGQAAGLTSLLARRGTVPGRVDSFSKSSCLPRRATAGYLAAYGTTPALAAGAVGFAAGVMQRSKGSKGGGRMLEDSAPYRGKGKGKYSGRGGGGGSSGGGDRRAAYKRGEALAGGQPVWNFAFGANINPWKLESSRGIKPLDAVRGKLPGWRLVFNHRGGFGSIEEISAAMPGGPDAVHGMLLLLNAQDFATLCSMEHQYEPTELEVEAYDGRCVNARCFISMPAFRTLAQDLAATERYMKLIREGAQQSGLDANYVTWLCGLPSLKGDRGPEYYEVQGAKSQGANDLAVSGTTPRSAPPKAAGVRPITLRSPTGVFVTKAGVYVADSGNDRVVRCPLPPEGNAAVASLRVDEGQVVAGGNGRGSAPWQLQRPFRLCVDEEESVYIVDRNNNRIMKWVLGASQGEVVAGGNGSGSGLNQLDQPSGVAVHEGHVFVVDRANHRVLRWAPGAKQGEVVAGGRGFGSRPDQLACPGDVTVTADGTLVISDEANNRIQAFAPGAAAGWTLAGGLVAGSGSDELYHPLGICLRTDDADASGVSVFVGDSLNYRVQRFRAHLTTAAGEHAQRLPSGATVAGGEGLGATKGQLGQPISVSFDSGSGRLYVADSDNGRIQVISPSEQERLAQVRRPSSSLEEEQLRLRMGRVVEFRRGGYGFIASEGKRYFAHHSDIVQEVKHGYPNLDKGVSVQFYERPDDKWGQRATNIQAV